MEPFKTTIEFTDEELKILNDVFRGTKVTYSNEEMLLIAMGKAKSPMLDLTHRLASLFEQRVKQIQETAPATKQAE